MINDSKISDHHAIIVTENIENHDLAKLSVGEKSILHLIITRMLCAVAKPFRYSETSLEAVVEDETFVSKTKQIIDLGYQQIEVDLLGKITSKRYGIIPRNEWAICIHRFYEHCRQADNSTKTLY